MDFAAGHSPAVCREYRAVELRELLDEQDRRWGERLDLPVRLWAFRWVWDCEPPLVDTVLAAAKAVQAGDVSPRWVGMWLSGQLRQSCRDRCGRLLPAG